MRSTPVRMLPPRMMMFALSRMVRSCNRLEAQLGEPRVVVVDEGPLVLRSVDVDLGDVGYGQQLVQLGVRVAVTGQRDDDAEYVAELIVDLESMTPSGRLPAARSTLWRRSLQIGCSSSNSSRTLDMMMETPVFDVEAR